MVKKICAILYAPTAVFWHRVFEQLPSDYAITAILGGVSETVKEQLQTSGRYDKIIDLSTALQCDCRTNDRELICWDDLRLKISDEQMQEAIRYDRVLSGQYRRLFSVGHRPRVNFTITRKIVSQILKKYEGLFLDDHFDVLFSEHWATAFSFIAYSIARTMNIDCVCMGYANVGARYLFVVNSTLGRFEECEKQFLSGINCGFKLEKWEDENNGELTACLDGKKPAYNLPIAIDFLDDIGRPSLSKGVRFISTLVRQITRSRNRTIFRCFDEASLEGYLSAVAFWCRRKLEKKIRRGLKFVPDYPYIYFPLHYQPEANVFLYSDEWDNQLATAISLAQALHFGERLLVKEAPAMVGFRPQRFYQQLHEIPNIELVSPSMDSMELIKKSRVVVTIAGTASLEAWLAGVPTVVLGSPYFKFLPGIESPEEKSVAGIRRAIDKSRISAPVSRELRMFFLKCVEDNSFDGFLSDRPNRNPNVLSAKNIDQFSHNLAHTFSRLGNSR